MSFFGYTPPKGPRFIKAIDFYHHNLANRLGQVLIIRPSYNLSLEKVTIRQCRFYQIISQIIERIVYNRLFNYLVKNIMPHPSQYGFQKYLSTEKAVILELQCWLADILNNEECYIGIFIDLIKDWIGCVWCFWWSLTLWSRN